MRTTQLLPIPDLNAYVGRQAIFDQKMNVVAYELLYRNSEENRARFSDANQATAATIFNSVVEIGLDTMVGKAPVWVNLPEDFLLGKLPLPMPPDRTVIEVLEDVPVTPALLEELRRFRREGYKIALDDFILNEQTRPLVDLAHYIKVDILNVPREEIERQFHELRPLGVPLVAEKISTHDEVTYLKELGFEYYQGHFLELPLIARSRRLPHNRAALLQLLGKLYEPRLDLRSIETTISADIGLSVRVLRLAGSVAMARGVPIGTMNQAVVRLGVEQVAALALVVLAAGFDDKPFELTRQALVRARMCEALAQGTHAPPEQLFTAGLLSLLDALLDRPFAEILPQLHVTPLIRDALLAGSGSMSSRIVEAARSQDRGDFNAVAATGLPQQKVQSAWFEAVRWVDGLIGAM